MLGFRLGLQTLHLSAAHLISQAAMTVYLVVTDSRLLQRAAILACMCVLTICNQCLESASYREHDSSACLCTVQHCYMWFPHCVSEAAIIILAGSNQHMRLHMLHATIAVQKALHHLGKLLWKCNCTRRINIAVIAELVCWQTCICKQKLPKTSHFEFKLQVCGIAVALPRGRLHDPLSTTCHFSKHYL